MKPDLKIHSKAHMLKAVIGNTLAAFAKGPAHQLIVLNYHGTQKKYLGNFKAQIAYLKKQYEIISPAQFEGLVKGKQPVKGRKLLLTFDDGIKNNLRAIEVLDQLGLSAYFFVVPGFIDTPAQGQKEFFIKNIRPVINPAIDAEEEDFTALSWDELKTVSARHAIGCHTYHHTMVKDVLSKEQLQEELITSKDAIEKQLPVNINTFCSINNTLLTIGKAERKMVEENYALHFTTFGGNNAFPDPYLIKRINVESHWLQGAFKFALSAFEQNRWQKNIDLYQKNTAA
jgi:peptidoglycan/xylan/chitin deacetylase (PgdA/CDA1 family)